MNVNRWRTRSNPWSCPVRRSGRPDHPGGQGVRAGRRLPRRRDDDRGRGRTPADRPEVGPPGHARPADRGRADHLRPAAHRLPGARPGPADVVVVAAGSSRRIAGTDQRSPTSAFAPDRLDGETRARRPLVERLVLVTSPNRSPRGGRRLAPGRRDRGHRRGATRQASVAAGVRHLDALDGGDGTGRDRGPRPRRRAAAVSPRAGRRPSRRLSRRTAPRSRCSRSPRRSSGCATALVDDTVPRESLAAAQTPQGARRALLLDAWAAFPPDGPPELHRRGRPARGL